MLISTSWRRRTDSPRCLSLYAAHTHTHKRHVHCICVRVCLPTERLLTIHARPAHAPQTRVLVYLCACRVCSGVAVARRLRSGRRFAGMSLCPPTGDSLSDSARPGSTRGFAGPRACRPPPAAGVLACFGSRAHGAQTMHRLLLSAGGRSPGAQGTGSFSPAARVSRESSARSEATQKGK